MLLHHLACAYHAITPVAGRQNLPTGSIDQGNWEPNGTARQPPTECFSPAPSAFVDRAKEITPLGCRFFLDISTSVEKNLHRQIQGDTYGKG